jgi:hypothetical protein
MTPDQIIQIEADNQRLRKALEDLKPFLIEIQNHEFNRKYKGKALYGFNGVDLTFDMLNSLLDALSHPSPTSGLLDVVRAAYRLHEYYLNNDLTPAVCDETYEIHRLLKALPPETLKMLEEVARGS